VLLTIPLHDRASRRRPSHHHSLAPQPDTITSHPAIISHPHTTSHHILTSQGMKEKMKELAKTLGIPNPGALNM
jgi:hypothetical protein